MDATTIIVLIGFFAIIVYMIRKSNKPTKYTDAPDTPVPAPHENDDNPDNGG